MNDPEHRAIDCPAPSMLTRRRMLRAMLGAGGALLGAATLSGSVEATNLASAPRRSIFPWVSFDEPAGLRSLRRHADLIRQVSPSWFELGPDLSITGLIDEGVAGLAVRKGMAVHPLIRNLNDDPGVALHVLATAQRRDRAAGKVADLVLANGFDGINLDFEGTFGAGRDGYSDFVARLAGRLRPAGKRVTVDVVPQLRPAQSYPNTSWAAPYDYAALGQRADAVILMAYAYSEPAPGPIAPLWWVREVIDYARGQVAASKLVVGLPFYGLHWTTRAGRTARTEVSVAEAQRLLARSGARLQRPAHDATPRFSWRDGQGLHVVHFEDALSLTAKLHVVQAAGVEGVAFWRLGQDGNGEWDVIARWLQGRL